MSLFSIITLFAFAVQAQSLDLARYETLTVEQKVEFFGGQSKMRLQPETDFVQALVLGVADSHEAVRRRATQRAAMTLAGLQQLAQSGQPVPVHESRARKHSMNMNILFFSLIIVGSAGHLIAQDPIEQILIPNALSPELEALPSIVFKRGWVDREPLSPEAKQAVTNQDLAKLSTMLATTDARVQRQAALGMGQLTEHQAEAREILSRFIAAELNPWRTEFGDQFFSRQTAINAAEQSLAALLAKAKTSERSAEIAMPAKTPEAKPSTVREPWFFSTLWFGIVLVSAAALGLVWLLLKKRKV
ncbi:hypothetical protein [Prosthecobacter dejongeii]|uniref:Uncharacterized protein n=1 Tax=Prosthecobacter dejongeii TaxID=48465 RepID=A0A7W7YHB8_9BACT|nr:hypothetical protein [Prosthecobacter dejongeii]MBB5036027.1 hypothetical protein [Prosthecobacter dejongeii]